MVNLSLLRSMKVVEEAEAVGVCHDSHHVAHEAAEAGARHDDRHAAPEAGEAAAGEAEEGGERG